MSQNPNSRCSVLGMMQTYLYHVINGDDSRMPARLIGFFLRGLSWIYGLAVAVILFGYRRGWLKTQHLPKPVISIGNLTWGGVGKTPLVEFTARYLQEKKIRPAVLLRGYRRKNEQAKNFSSIGDEAQYLREVLKNIPVAAGADRVRSAGEILRQGGADIFILDDGFQHWRLLRNLDVVVIDSVNPFGNGNLIPSGILREPPGALSRADLVVLTKTDLGRANVPSLKKTILRIKPGLAIVETVHQPAGLKDILHPQTQHDPDILNQKQIGAFCAIGDPDSFKNLLIRSRAEVVDFVSFVDHYEYRDADVRSIITAGKKNSVSTWITTEKDAVKLHPYLDLFKKEGLNLWSLLIRIKITQGADEFFDRITHLL